MTVPTPRLFFDYVDPVSYVLELRLRTVEAELGVEAARHPLELAPPPADLVDPVGDDFAERWRLARDAAQVDGIDLRRPSFVPWSRKAHELVLHAREKGAGLAVHDAVFGAFHLEGRDIGRVDVLLEIAVAAGLDNTETRAVLDVDRHLESVRTLRHVAERLALPGVPTLLTEHRMLKGLLDVDALREALSDEVPEHPTETR